MIYRFSLAFIWKVRGICISCVKGCVMTCNLSIKGAKNTNYEARKVQTKQNYMHFGVTK